MDQNRNFKFIKKRHTTHYGFVGSAVGTKLSVTIRILLKKSILRSHSLNALVRASLKFHINPLQRLQEGIYIFKHWRKWGDEQFMTSQMLYTLQRMKNNVIL